MTQPEKAHTALEGIRVLDLGVLVQAPQAAQLLGDRDTARRWEAAVDQLLEEELEWVILRFQNVY